MTVLVIEAGPLDAGQDGILVPGAYAPWYYFWPGLNTVPQTGLNNRTISAITAQVVGGGSTINAMVYLRCAPPPSPSPRMLISRADLISRPGAMWTIIMPGVRSGTRAGAGQTCSRISRRSVVCFHCSRES